MIEDSELLRRYVETGSEDAFAELVRRNIGFVYAAALRQLGGAAHRAEEVTQTVFIDLARKAAGLSRRAELLGWLHTSTHFAAAKLKRTEQRRQEREQEAQMMNDRVMAGGTEVDWERLRPVLDEAMHELSAGDREAVLMRYFRGWRFAEIGQRLGLTEDAARMRVERALEKLRVALGRRRITSTTAALGVILANQPTVAVPAGLATTVASAALAGAAGSLVGAATLFFMNAKPMIGGVLAVVMAGVALYETNDAREQRTAAAALGRERDALQAQVREMQQRVGVLEKRPAATPPPARTMKEATAFAMPPAAEADPGVGRQGGELYWVKGTPETAARAEQEQREFARRNIDYAYAALCRWLQFTPDQRERFTALMVEREVSSGPLFRAALAAARKQNPTIDRTGIFEVYESTKAQVMLEQQMEVRRVFGDAAGQAMERYQATLPVRMIANQLVSAFFDSTAPLSPSQVDSLVEVLARHAPGKVGTVDPAELNPEAAAAEALARGLLNAAQAAEMRKVATAWRATMLEARERSFSPTR
jgi:RNA polymerase sigma factor (sigma-70 family)